MFACDGIAGSWDALVERLERSDAVARWARAEPALQGVGAVADLTALTAEGSDRADGVLAALVRTGSARGGNELDAVALVLHLLSPGATRMAAELTDLHPRALQLVVGALTVAVRSYGDVGLRGAGAPRRSVAANLLRTARRAVLRELRPHCTPKRPRDTDVLIDPTNAASRDAVFDRPMSGPGDAEDDLDLGDVLRWAERCGIASRRDLRVLLDSERSRDRFAGAKGQAAIAAGLGIHPSTLRRRRERALRALRDAHRDYLDRWVVA